MEEQTLSWLTTAVLSVLNSFLTKAGEKGSETIGEKLAEKSMEAGIWKTVKSFFINEDDKKVFESIEKKSVATTSDLAEIKDKLSNLIETNQASQQELKACLNISRYNEFFIETTCETIAYKETEFKEVLLKSYMLDKIHRGAYEVKLREIDSDLRKSYERLSELLRRE